MKLITLSGLALLLISCGSAENRHEQLSLPPDPLEETKRIFEAKTAGYDSVSVEETDSTYTFFVLPATGDTNTGKELFGSFSIEKKTVIAGDLNHDGLEDAVVQYSFTPHYDNNTLIYFKVLLQKAGKLEEAGEIYGGGRCEGPILKAGRIHKGMIRFKGSVYAEGDPCCCPSVEKDYSFTLEKGRVVNNSR